MRVMLFGDSHLAAVKRGLSLAPPPEGLEVSLWGTPGARFRMISWRDGAIEPDDAQTARAFARFSSDGALRLEASAYDAVVFIGARISYGAVLPELVRVMVDPRRHLSRAYLKAVLRARLEAFSTYGIARAMAAEGTARVLVNPVSLDTAGKTRVPRAFRAASQAGSEKVATLWSLVAEILAEDGLTPVLQPLATVVGGYLTEAKYGVEAPHDPTHKTPEYGALVLAEIYRALGAS